MKLLQQYFEMILLEQSFYAEKKVNPEQIPTKEISTVLDLLRIYCIITYQKAPKILAWQHVEKLDFVGAVDRCVFHCMETRLIISRPNA